MNEKLRLAVKRTLIRVLLKVHNNAEDVLEQAIRPTRSRSLIANILGQLLFPASVRAGAPVFVHIARNGGTSISSALYGETIGHFTVEFFHKIATAANINITTFAVLRDPVDRCVSAFNFISAGGA